jgi:hypothetical protein
VMITAPLAQEGSLRISELANKTCVVFYSSHNINRQK